MTKFPDRKLGREKLRRLYKKYKIKRKRIKITKIYGYNKKMEIIFDLKGLRGAVSGWKNQSNSIALVPTMGNLHLGHLSLIEGAKDKADRTVVSIFVNPNQFNDKNDFKNYPKNLKKDFKILKKLKVDIVYLPSISQIYKNDKFPKITLKKKQMVRSYGSEIMFQLFYLNF